MEKIFIKHRFNIKKILKMKASSIAALLLTTSIPAHATGMIAGATFPEQIVQEITLVEQYATQAEQLQAQYQQVFNQAINMEAIPVQLWPNISGQLGNLVNLVGNAQGLSYAALNTVSGIQAQYGQPDAPLSNFASSLSSWTQNIQSQIAAALQQFNQHAGSYTSTQAALAAIQAQSNSAAGRKEVMQAGNQISGILVNKIQKLRADIEANGQVEMNALAASAGTNNDAVQAMAPILSAPIQPGAF